MMELWKKWRFLAYAVLWSGGAVAAFVAAQMSEESGRKQAGYIHTEGTLKRVWSTTHGRGKKNVEIRVYAGYTYTVKGKRYSLGSTDTSYWKTSSSRKAVQKIAELQNKKTIDVWYDPNEPRRAVTRRLAGTSARIEYGVSIIAGLVGLGYLAAFFITLFLARRKQQAEG